MSWRSSATEPQQWKSSRGCSALAKRITTSSNQRNAEKSSASTSRNAANSSSSSWRRSTEGAARRNTSKDNWKDNLTTAKKRVKIEKKVAEKCKMCEKKTQKKINKSLDEWLRQSDNYFRITRGEGKKFCDKLREICSWNSRICFRLLTLNVNTDWHVRMSRWQRDTHMVIDCNLQQDLRSVCELQRKTSSQLRSSKFISITKCLRDRQSMTDDFAQLGNGENFSQLRSFPKALVDFENIFLRKVCAKDCDLPKKLPEQAFGGDCLFDDFACDSSGFVTLVPPQIQFADLVQQVASLDCHLRTVQALFEAHNISREGQERLIGLFWIVVGA